MTLKKRENEKCPICQDLADNILSLEFVERKGLPSNINLSLCEECDFAFTWPACPEGYAKYYSNNTNDLFSEINQNNNERYLSQTNILSKELDVKYRKRILDIGCGAGDLLRTLQNKYPQHEYYGVDANIVSEEKQNGIIFTNKFIHKSEYFDLIIMSHALEHFVEWSVFELISDVLTEKGVVFIEVPDCLRYSESSRSEYLYYIDRLHVNHFTFFSLSKLLDNNIMHIIEQGTHDFKYKDNFLYPSLYVFAAKSNDFDKEIVNYKKLRKTICSYIINEKVKAENYIDKNFYESKEILVYGFGDNFFRSKSIYGPLGRCKIIAVLDKNWKVLKENKYGNIYNFMSPKEAFAEYADVPVVVTVSWSTDVIVQELKEIGFSNILVV